MQRGPVDPPGAERAKEPEAAHQPPPAPGARTLRPDRRSNREGVAVRKGHHSQLPELRRGRGGRGERPKGEHDRSKRVVPHLLYYARETGSFPGPDRRGRPGDGVTAT